MNFYFKKYYNSTAFDLNKQEVLDADPKAIEQIKFSGNLDQDRGGDTMFFVIKKVKETILNFYKET